MSKARQKGTQYENYLKHTFLERVWPTVERAPLKGTNDYGDFVNVGGWLIEAKKRDRWSVGEWVKTVLKKVATNPRADGRWAILFAGDKRLGIPDLTVLPTETFVRLVGRQGRWSKAGYWLSGEREDREDDRTGVERHPYG